MPPKINIEWDFILDKLQTDSTILCLGAELYSNTIGKLDLHLYQAIGESPDVRIYEDGLFLFKNSSDLIAHLKIKKFYNQDLPEVTEVLDKLAQIRFSTIVSLNPDGQLKKSFKNQGFTCQYDYHHPNRTARELAQPTCDEPLIYNLLGDIQFRESMVLTHENLFEFLESVIEGKSIPKTLKEKVKSANNFIFVGLPFDKWHTQLLVRVLQKDVNKRALKFAANHAKDKRIEMFCLDEFNIICVPTNIADFVSELHNQCQAAGLLRGASNASLCLYNTWINKVRKDELKEVLDEIVDYFKKNYPNDTDNNSDLVLLAGRLHNLDRKINKGNISHENASIERAQIREAIIDFLNDVVKPLGI